MNSLTEASREPLAVSVTIPVFNEAGILEQSVKKLHRYLEQTSFGLWEIVIADNGSTDGTPLIAAALSTAYSDVRWIRLSEKGRGRAIKRAWGESAAEVLSYMDVDLSTDLIAFCPLIGPLLNGDAPKVSEKSDRQLEGSAWGREVRVK